MESTSFKKVDFKKWLNLERFSKDTSLHGFKQLYYNKNVTLKILWAIFLFGAILASVIQLSKAVITFNNQPMITKIEPLKKGHLFYPSLRLCYDQWPSWVDFSKVLSYNITKPLLMYSLSYLNSIFSNETFDEKSVKAQFSNLMKVQNWSDIIQFYFAIAKDRPNGLQLNEYQLFTEKDIISGLFCYKTNGEHLAEIISNPTIDHKRRDFKEITFQLITETDHEFRRYVDDDEFSEYIKEHTGKMGFEVTRDALDKFQFGTILMPDHLDDLISVTPEYSEYKVKVRANVHRWRSTFENHCLMNEKTSSSNSTCEEKCFVEVLKNICGCNLLLSKRLRQNYSLDSYCRWKISPLWGNASYSSVDCSYFTDISISGNSKSVSFKNAVLSCSSRCKERCERWDYDISLRVRNTPVWLRGVEYENETSISLKYATEQAIVVFCEVDLQTWETFVANVGGLLGIWLGASIVSFIQAVYLCCCSHYIKDES